MHTILALQLPSFPPLAIFCQALYHTLPFRWHTGSLLSWNTGLFSAYFPSRSPCHHMQSYLLNHVKYYPFKHSSSLSVVVQQLALQHSPSCQLNANDPQFSGTPTPASCHPTPAKLQPSTRPFTTAG